MKTEVDAMCEAAIAKTYPCDGCGHPINMGKPASAKDWGAGLEVDLEAGAVTWAICGTCRMEGKRKAP